MAKDNKKNEAPKDGEPRRFCFSLSTTGIVSLGVVVIFGVIWVFILGVLVGRGYKPERDVPELEKIMPRAEAPAEATKKGVLKPEELEFFDKLKQSPSDQAKDAPKKAKPKAEPPVRKVEKAKDKKEVVKPAPKPEPAIKVTQASGPRFAYMYQVAATRDVAKAKAFAAKVEKFGYKTSVVEATTSSGTWHRVNAHFQGTPDETQKLKDDLATLGVKKPIMKTKKPL